MKDKGRRMADAGVAAMVRDDKPGKEYTPAELCTLSGDLIYNLTASQRALTGQVRVDPPFTRVKDSMAAALKLYGRGRVIQVRTKRKCSITGHQCFAWRLDASAK
jgi:hypothetical protein